MAFDPWRTYVPKLEWEAWRSREVRFVKPFKNSRQEECYRDKAGNVYPAESFVREYEKLTPNEQAEHSG